MNGDTINLTLPPIGFGCEQLGGHAWGKVSKAEIEAAIQIALENGLTLFDTADVYGIGASEAALGLALGKKRHLAQIMTKGGVRLSDNNSGSFHDSSSAWLRAALESSLKRLNTEYIDFYVLHYWDQITPWDSIIETMEHFVREGKIRAWGLSNPTQALTPLSLPRSCRLLQIEFSLARRDHEAISRNLTEEKCIRPVFFGCLGQGILSGKYSQQNSMDPYDRRNQSKYINFHGERLKHNLKIVDSLKNLSEQTGHSIPQIAFRWILDYWPNSTILSGIKSPEQLKDLLSVLNWKLESDQIEQLNSISLGKQLK